MYQKHEMPRHFKSDEFRLYPQQMHTDATVFYSSEERDEYKIFPDVSGTWFSDISLKPKSMSYRKQATQNKLLNKEDGYQGSGKQGKVETKEQETHDNLTKDVCVGGKEERSKVLKDADVTHENAACYENEETPGSEYPQYHIGRTKKWPFINRHTQANHPVQKMTVFKVFPFKNDFRLLI